MPDTFIGTFTDWFNWTSEKSKNGIEKLHEKSNLPWWTTITGITIGVRIIVFPFRLRAWKNGRLMKLTTEHCNKTEAPRLREYHQKNTAKEKRSELFKEDMLKAHSETMKAIGVSPWKSLSPLPVSVPLFLSVAAGLRAIDFGGEGLGWLWPDFGEAELMSAVPVALSNIIFLEYTRSQQKQEDSSSSSWRRRLPFVIGHLINICSFVVLTRVPSAVNLFLLTSSMMSVAESRILKAGDKGVKEVKSVKDVKGVKEVKGIGGLLDRWVESEFKRLIEEKNMKSI